jgi:hypothetical protein
MTASRPDDRFERDLSRFLDWQARQLDGAPGNDEMARRLAGRLGSTTSPRGVRLTLAPSLPGVWAIAVLGLLLTLAAGFALVAGQRGVTRDDARCSLDDLTLPPRDAPSPGKRLRGLGEERVAYPDGRDGTPAEDVIVETSEASVIVATFVPGSRESGAHRLLAWAPSGSQLLVGMTPRTRSREEPGCQDLWLVSADGTSVRPIARSNSEGLVGWPSFAPDGRIAYVAVDASEALGLHVVDASGGDREVTRICDGAVRPSSILDTPPAWAPNGDRVAVACETRVEIVDIATAAVSAHRLLDGVVDLGSIIWPTDDRLLVAGATSADSVDLVIGGLEPPSGTSDVIVTLRDDADHDWRLPTGGDVFSADGRHLLVSATVSAPDGRLALTPHVVELATGGSMPLSTWPEAAGWWGVDRTWSVTPAQELVTEATDGTGFRVVAHAPTSPLVWVPPQAGR